MNSMEKYLIRVIIAAIAILGLPIQEHVSACTSFVLRAEDGTAVYGRTMEWGTFDLKSRLVVVPRGYALSGHTPDGGPGLVWKGK